ncbi:Transmembrane protease serine 11A, partial [Orchesella cincta]
KRKLKSRCGKNSGLGGQPAELNKTSSRKLCDDDEEARFLLVGLALGSPIGQVSDEQVTTSLPEIQGRSELDATTVVVEILADEAVTSATQRARQDGVVEGEDEEDEEEEATTASGSTRPRAPTRVPAPPANSSDFLAEYQYSSQFELGPKAGAALAAPAVPAVAAVDPAAQPVAQVAPSQPQPASVIIPIGQNQLPAAAAAGGEEDEDAESDEADVTDAPTARLQQSEPQRVEESDSDNEITSDDATTVKSFASEYEYTVQQLGSERKGETDDTQVPTVASVISSSSSATQNETGLDDLDIEMGILSDGDGRAACECGKLPFRVPIGEEAEINLRPWTVAIVRGGLIAGGRPHCSGVLINDRYVLTSASCMDGLHPSGIQVWLTAHSTLNNHNLNVGTSKMNVQEVVVHPNYNRGNKENQLLHSVCLPSVSNYNYAGRHGTIFGWGQGRINRVCTTSMPIIENYVCTRDSKHSLPINDNMMCAGYLTPNQPIRTDDCIGDAGGPLTVLINGRTSLIGITSWGFEFHNRGHTPTVFTKVSGYADWILHNTEDADCQSHLSFHFKSEHFNMNCKSDLIFITFLFSSTSSNCIQNEQKEESHFLQIQEHPEIDENSPYDPTPFMPHDVPKWPPPAVISTCRCGEHEFNESRVEPRDCGERPFNDNRIRSNTDKAVALVENGTFTDKSQFPWVVALVERKLNGSAIHFCGGTLISSKLVLTATHCFSRRQISQTEVWLNERNFLLVTDVDHPTIKIKALRLIVHPNYNPIMNYNDIVLVELSEHVNITERYLRPICLPRDQSYDEKEYAFTAGWGQISRVGPKSDELRHVCLPLLSHADCINKTVSYYKNRVNEYMICAGDIKNGGRDACPGDSGGPLFVEAGEANRHYLVGIVSWGEQCGLKKRPGVYTRVSRYLPWIHEQALLIEDNKLCE